MCNRAPRTTSFVCLQAGDVNRGVLSARLGLSYAMLLAMLDEKQQKKASVG